MDRVSRPETTNENVRQTGNDQRLLNPSAAPIRATIALHGMGEQGKGHALCRRYPAATAPLIGTPVLVYSKAARAKHACNMKEAKPIVTIANQLGLRR